MRWVDVLLSVALAEGEIRVLPPAEARTVSVRFVLKTLKLATTNEFAAVNVAGLNGEPLQFIRRRARTLSAVLSFDGRATNTDVRQLMRPVIELMRVDRHTHAPPVLSFEWSGQSFQCVLERVTEEFRALFSDGRPSRGRMHVVFRESLTLTQLEQEAERE